MNHPKTLALLTGLNASLGAKVDFLKLLMPYVLGMPPRPKTDA